MVEASVPATVFIVSLVLPKSIELFVFMVKKYGLWDHIGRLRTTPATKIFVSFSGLSISALIFALMIFVAGPRSGPDQA